MWSIAISTVMVSIAGALVLASFHRLPAQRDGSVAAMAESMAVYRTAVVRYFGKHDEQRDRGVDLAALRADGALRDWSNLAAGHWDNYRSADGTIYIFGTEPSAPAVGAALARQSRNSLLAGTYRSGSASLYSTVHGDTGIELAPLLARRALRDGAPVWLAGAP